MSTRYHGANGSCVDNECGSPHMPRYKQRSRNQTSPLGNCLDVQYFHPSRERSQETWKMGRGDRSHGWDRESLRHGSSEERNECYADKSNRK